MSGDRTWNAWPVCSGCGRRRQTVCPTCGGAGSQFPLADYQQTAEPQRPHRQPAQRDPDSPPPRHGLLLICPRCDEAFTPRFYRFCPGCGDDAGEGVELDHGESEPVNDRVLLAVYGLVAVAALVLLYFWLLFRDS